MVDTRERDRWLCREVTDELMCDHPALILQVWLEMISDWHDETGRYPGFYAVRPSVFRQTTMLILATRPFDTDLLEFA